MLPQIPTTIRRDVHPCLVCARIARGIRAKQWNCGGSEAAYASLVPIMRIDGDQLTDWESFHDVFAEGFGFRSSTGATWPHGSTA